MPLGTKTAQNRVQNPRPGPGAISAVVRLTRYLLTTYAIHPSPKYAQRSKPHNNGADQLGAKIPQSRAARYA